MMQTFLKLLFSYRTFFSFRLHSVHFCTETSLSFLIQFREIILKDSLLFLLSASFLSLTALFSNFSSSVRFRLVSNFPSSLKLPSLITSCFLFFSSFSCGSFSFLLFLPLIILCSFDSLRYPLLLHERQILWEKQGMNKSTLLLHSFLFSQETLAKKNKRHNERNQKK